LFRRVFAILDDSVKSQNALASEIFQLAKGKTQAVHSRRPRFHDWAAGTPPFRHLDQRV